MPVDVRGQENNYMNNIPLEGQQNNFLTFVRIISF